MKQNKNGTVNISIKELMDIAASVTLEDESLFAMVLNIPEMALAFGHFMCAVCERIYDPDVINNSFDEMLDELGDSVDEMLNKLGKDIEKNTKSVSEPAPIRKDVIDKINRFFDGFFPKDKSIQIFDTRNMAGDNMSTIYSDDDVIIDYCSDHDYVEVFGLTSEEFMCLVNSNSRLV